MFNKFKSALYSAVGVEEEPLFSGERNFISPNATFNITNALGASKVPKERLQYTRPAFLQLNTADEVMATADHAVRPIICPRSILPWHAGYAETINAGKSKLDEDQASVFVGLLTTPKKILKQNGCVTSADFSLSADNCTQKEHLNSKLVTEKCSANAQNSAEGTAHDASVVDCAKVDEVKLSSNCEGSTCLDTEAVNCADDFNTTVHEVELKDDILTVTQTSVKPEATTEVASDNTLSSNCAIQNSFVTSYPRSNGSGILENNETSNALMSSSISLAEEATNCIEISSPTSSPYFCTPLNYSKLFISDGSDTVNVSLPYYYFAVFDGHAGWGAAVYSSQYLHQIVHSCLSKVVTYLIPDRQEITSQWMLDAMPDPSSVIVGALEEAFYLMDKKIERDRHRLNITGGCTACIALFINGKLYVANAGDSRACLCLHKQARPMSFDFTPETENYRLRKLGSLHPELLGGEFSSVEFFRRPLRRDLGNMVLCRHPYMTRGWVHKRVTEDDLKCPLVHGTGKRSRVMATIGVTRGFGDHDLKAQCTTVLIKPFLSSEPEVRILDLCDEVLSDTDVLILATDGLWDIISNEQASLVLLESMARSMRHLPSSDPHRHKYRYTSAAQDLVMSARGKLVQNNWRTSDGKHATIDDIAVFVIPLKAYQIEHLAWCSQLDLEMGFVRTQQTDTEGCLNQFQENSRPSAIDESLVSNGVENIAQFPSANDINELALMRLYEHQKRKSISELNRVQDFNS